MVELFGKLKLNYKECVIFFQSENSYVVFEEDAFILCKFFDYKVEEEDDTIKITISFDEMQKVVEKLREVRVSYVVFNGEELLEEVLFDDNSFLKYAPSMYEILNMDNRMRKILFQLKNLDEFGVRAILDRIEEDIRKYSD